VRSDLILNLAKNEEAVGYLLEDLTSYRNDFEKLRSAVRDELLLGEV
jgi:hypothetical protein